MTDQYPERAGFTERETSKDAADAIEGSGKAQTLRYEVHRVLRLDQLMCGVDPTRSRGMTADEIAAEMGESILSIRPRVAELHKQGIVMPSGKRRKSSGGKASHVWELT